MQRGFKSWAEQEARRRRRALHLRATDPLPAMTLANHLNVAVISPREIPGITPEVLHHLLVEDYRSWSAVTVAADDCVVVIQNTSHSPARQESDLMHELAHLICSHEPGRIVRLPTFPFPLREYDTNQEEEASWLGGCLQLPRNALWWALRQGFSEADFEREFGASRDLIRYRRGVTGVDVQLARLQKSFR